MKAVVPVDATSSSESSLGVHPGEGKIVVVDQIEQLSELTTQWSRLAHDLPFCDPAWMLTWWDNYGQSGDRELLVLCVYEGEQLVGLAPWFREQEGVGGCIIRFLGAGDVCSDYLNILAEPGKEQFVATQLAGWLAKDEGAVAWEQLQIECIPADSSSTLNVLLAELENLELVVSRTESDSCWRIALPDEMAEYVAKLSKNQRYQMRRAHRDQLASGNVTYELATTPEQIEQLWPVFVELHQRRREALGEPGCFADEVFAKFLHDATVKLAESGKAAIFILRENDQPVAAEHQLLGSQTAFAYQSGLDPERMELCPGKLANYVTIEAAIEAKRTHFDFLRGDEPYKALFRAEPVECHDIRVIANSVSAKLKHQMWATSQQLKTLVKKAIKE